MNGASDAGGWAETLDQKSGRPYFYNTVTNETSWNKPDQLLTPSQKATGWTQTSTQEGRLYWFNKLNRTEVSWNAPQGWEEPAGPPARGIDHGQYQSSNFRDEGSRELTRYDQSRDLAQRDDHRRDRGNYEQAGGYRGPVASNVSGFENASQAEKEAAFTKLLKRFGVQRDWSWSQAMAAVVKEPAYRALKDTRERREVFEEYQADLKREETEKEQARVVKLKSDFRAMLQRYDNVRRYSTWKNVRPTIEREAVFRSTDKDDERKAIFDEYVADLQQQYQEKRYKDHEEAMRELGSIMKEVNIGPETRWADAQVLLENNASFKHEKFDTLTKSEVLDTFVGHVRGLWDDVNSAKQRSKQTQIRKARKAREGYMDLLSELHNQDAILADTPFKTALPLISADPRYEALLGNIRTGDPRDDGSSPLELYLDFIDDLDRDVRDLAVHAEVALKSARIKMRPDLELSDLLSAVRHDKRLAHLSEAKLALVHKRVMSQITASIEDAAAADRRHERRRRIDDLRSRIKRLEPPVTLDDTWDLVRPRIERLEEYAILTDEDDRRAAFDKHIQRLQDDIDRDRRHRDHRDRDRRRDRSRSPRRRSITPAHSNAGNEHNAYAEDRRRAIEQRERQYRNTSGTTGLSPPPRMRRRDDRRPSFDDNHRPSFDDPGPPRRRGTGYSAGPPPPSSRADTYSRGEMLDYGDEGGVVPAGPPAPTAVRLGNGKRAGEEMGKEGKRVKMEEEEDKGLQSGSEEGEIEEV